MAEDTSANGPRQQAQSDIVRRCIGERKVRLAHRDVIVWHRDDITFYPIPKDGRRDRQSREAEIGLDWFSFAPWPGDHQPFRFTAQTISPSILWDLVEGYVISMRDDYIAMSQPHFSLPISDEQYRSVLAVVDRWRKYPQPSYSLDTRNCVTFVKEIALALKLPASNDVKFIRNPKDFLEDLQMRIFKTDRIVTTETPEQPISSTRLHTNKMKAERAEN